MQRGSRRGASGGGMDAESRTTAAHRAACARAFCTLAAGRIRKVQRSAKVKSDECAASGRAGGEQVGSEPLGVPFNSCLASNPYEHDRAVLRGGSRAPAVRARTRGVHHALSRYHLLRLWVRSRESAAQARSRTRQHRRIRAVSRAAVSLFRRAFAFDGDPVPHRRRDRLPVPARRRADRMADDGEAEPRTVRRRARHLSLRRRAVYRAIRMTEAGCGGMMRRARRRHGYRAIERGDAQEKTPGRSRSGEVTGSG
ncbi:protein of unknown function [Burkholderia multivorans]